MKKYWILIISILISSCDLFYGEFKDFEPIPIPNSHNFELYLDYWNTTGTDPEINIDFDGSSEEIRINLNKEWGSEPIGTDSIQVFFDNIRISDALSDNYIINSIYAEELVNDEWRSSSEFRVTSSFITRLDVILALDVSASLTDNFDNIKRYALNFMSVINNNSENSRIGVVLFSTDVDSLPLTDDINATTLYINNAELGQFTALYDGMNIGIEMLQNSTKEAKVICTFTDGSDNNSLPQNTPTSLENKLNIPDSNDVFTESMIIGLNSGDLDTTILKNLATNELYSFPNDIIELEQIFDKFSKIIANVYTLTYIRSQQQILANDKRKIRFVINASKI